MNKLLIISAFSLFLFASCGDGPDKKQGTNTEAKGGVYMGGILRTNEVEAFKSLMPISINEVNSYHIASQVYEGLVKYNQVDMTILPGIAHSWDISEDKKEYVFHLRSNVKFHDDPCFAGNKGRMVKAEDVKYCMEKLCSIDPFNNQFDVTLKDRVVGANESFEGSKTGKNPGVSGITVINDSTLKINLLYPDVSFLSILAMPGCYVYPKEAVMKYGKDMRAKCVGTGPFFVETIKEGEVVIMKKNADYWGVDADGNRLPYLDGIKWSFIRDKKSEILEFKRGNLDMVYRIPVEMFHEFMGDLEHAKTRESEFEILSSPALNTFYYGFNVQANPVFAKKEVRLAFNAAIDRQKIADFTIQGEGNAAEYGIVPYAEIFENAGYDYKSINGYKYDVDKAKELMKQAGYPGGKGFPELTLQINSGGGDRNILIAEVVQKMLKENLGVTININTIPFAEHIENIQTGKGDFFRFAWVADYPGPETFLTLFYGKHVPKSLSEKSYINTFRYINPKFDSIFEMARFEPDQAKRMKLFSEAENIMLADAPFIPIFYDENFRLEQKNVRNLPENVMNYMDMTTTYLIPPDKMPTK
ncbi:MAG: ABC transporter substrate-binding protein [Sphingobacteriaceae bacterium]|nr:ABC transporter substrate-binding protein [Sphingobacteriaceae bacterium]